jgi:hypothetical protein
MEFKDTESQSAAHSNFMYDTIYFQAPDEYDDIESDLENDEEDEDFDDRAEDIDDLHEIQADDDLNEPDSDKYDITRPDPEDDHLPDEDLQ